MAYRLLPQNGDSISVPQLVLKNLNNGREDYFRVALFLLGGGEAEPSVIAAALGLKNEATVQKALAFWQGAGLLEEIPDAERPQPELKKEKPRLTTREVLLHSGQNPEIAVLMQEAQRIFGEVISEGGCNILATMYVNDEMPLDYLLLGLANFAAQGFTSRKLSVIQRRLQSWQAEGVRTMPQLEEYLALQEARREQQAEVARLMKCSPEAFTASDKGKINLWYEKYRYTEPMLSLALDMVGDSDKKTVAYLNGILKKWYAQGYRQPRDVLAAQQGSNAMPTGRTAVSRGAPQQDILQKKRGWVPKFQLEDD